MALQRVADVLQFFQQSVSRVAMASPAWICHQSLPSLCAIWCFSSLEYAAGSCRTRVLINSDISLQMDYAVGIALGPTTFSLNYFRD